MQLAHPFRTLTPLPHETEEAAKRKGIRGYELTPFLLSDLATRSKGQTLRANLALLEQNAAVAAQLSVSLKKII